MDLKKLLNEHKYSEILSLTNNKEDADSISYRISAYIGLSNYKEALKEIKIHNDLLYKKNPLATMNLHLELLLELKMYAEAISMHHEYSERPYISQQVEEFLREVPNKIIKSQKRNEAQDLFLDEEKVNELFIKSKDEALLTNAIYHLKKLELSPYLNSLANLLKRVDVSDDIKTLALLIMVMKKVNKDIVIIKNKKEFKINPVKLEAPYAMKQYKEIMELIVKLSKDPTIESVASNLFNQYVLISFPGLIFNDTSKKMSVAFIALAKRYLKEENAVNEVIKDHNESVSEINALMNLYQNKIEHK
ncbi:MAG: hypothetical protein MJ214_02925 [Bacilli bacterium]|nr:hypothetical protein [Bacilli bacterium]